MEIARWQLAFSLEPDFVVEVIRDALGIIGVLHTLDWVRELRKRWDRASQKLLRDVTGLSDHPIPASIGRNEWHCIDGKGGLYHRGREPLPPFNDIGLHALPAVLQDRLEERAPDEAFILTETALILGGSRISPSFMEKLTGEKSGLPFRFRDKAELRHPVTEPARKTLAKLHRGFKRLEDGAIYSKKLNVGRYVVDTEEPDRPSFGPFADDYGVRSDVLILSVLPNLRGGRTIVANAAYGCNSRIASILLEPRILDPMMTRLGRWNGDDALQAVFTVQQECQETLLTNIRDEKTGESHRVRVALEEYGEPYLQEPKDDIKVVKGWRSGPGEQILRDLRREFEQPNGGLLSKNAMQPTRGATKSHSVPSARKKRSPRRG